MQRLFDRLSRKKNGGFFYVGIFVSTDFRGIDEHSGSI